METKTIAVIASLDTKSDEVSLIRDLIEERGHKPFLIDVGRFACDGPIPDIRTLEVVNAVSPGVDSLEGFQRPKLIELLVDGIQRVIQKLFTAGTIDGVLSIGGAQNTIVAKSAMAVLPLGFPKLIVSTVASGKRTFESIAGTRDIVMIPSVVDFTGRNSVSDSILSNAVSAMAGMVEHAGKPLDLSGRTIVGASLMGVVDGGVSRAIAEVRQAGYEVLSFHTTGVGGRILDEFIRSGMISAVMDLSLHEVVGECFGGYSSGTVDRLGAAGNAGIPQVVAPGAVDFLDFPGDAIPFSLDNRKYIYHNSGIVHIKATVEEARKVAEVICDRLNRAKGPVVFLLPLHGFRQDVDAGEALFDPRVDEILVETFRKKIDPGIRIVEVDANINDVRFSQIASETLIGLLSEQARGELPFTQN